MATEVLLPKLGLTMTEGTVTEILVRDGTQVAVGMAIITVATDKVDVDIEAESAGLFHAAVGTGVTLAPGAVLGWLLQPGESTPRATASPTPSTDATPATPGTSAGPVADTTTVPVNADGRLFVSPNARRVARQLGVDLHGLHGTGPGGRIVSEDVEEAVTAAPAAVVSPVTTAGNGLSDVDLKPPLRKLARDLGVDISRIVPTGPDGSPLRADVLAAAQRSSAPITASGENAVIRVIPMTGMRGAIAGRMHASLQESAQLTHGYRVQLDALVEVRSRLKAESDVGDVVPSINDFLVRAVALALREHPYLNATIVAGEIRHLQDIHLGLAVAVPNGLYVPVIRHADQLGLLEIATETRALAAAARAGKVALSQLEGGTFTVSSLGAYGVEMFTPVLNPGNVGILGVGQIRDGVRWEDDRPVRTREATLSLTFDHRAVDGVPAAEFLRTLDGLLGRPLHLLLT